MDKATLKIEPVQLHQPIGFSCCKCNYKCSGNYCSNPDEPNCPHRTEPFCRKCPIIFTKKQDADGWASVACEAESFDARRENDASQEF
ncbi:hypothetical protein F5B20DRAFT_539549 [Whalleya microplaca]|nr:hypothetical protein F5B20DRAFT_539549 [Whalleya microplaca]